MPCTYYVGMLYYTRQVLYFCTRFTSVYIILSIDSSSSSSSLFIIVLLFFFFVFPRSHSFNPCFSAEILPGGSSRPKIIIVVTLRRPRDRRILRRGRRQPTTSPPPRPTTSVKVVICIQDHNIVRVICFFSYDTI